MEEDEIELWYEDEKQKLSELYIKSIAQGMSVEKREKKFSKAMEKLALKYEKKHAAYRAAAEMKKRRNELLAALGMPFVATGRAAASTYSFIFGGTAKTLKESYSDMRFNAKLVNIRHTYKIVDALHSFFRPIYFFYAKHLQLPLLIITRPFVRMWNSIKKTVEDMKEFFSKVFGTSWKYSKTAAKFISVHAVSLQKKLAAKAEASSKKYNEWQSKRVQAHLDKKESKRKAREDKNTGAAINEKAAGDKDLAGVA